MAYPVVNRATFSPARCVVSGDIDGPFFDLGSIRAINPRIYVHVPVIEACARQLGWNPPADTDEIAQLQARISELEPKAVAWDALTNSKELVASG